MSKSSKTNSNMHSSRSSVSSLTSTGYNAVAAAAEMDRRLYAVVFAAGLALAFRFYACYANYVSPLVIVALSVYRIDRG